MAGRARFHALKAEFERRTRDSFEDDGTKTHLDFVCEWLECGRTGKELAKDLEQSLGFELSYARLMSYLRESFGDTETEERMDSARTKSAAPMAEEALTIVDAEAYSNVDVARAASRARTRQWMAERYNPSRFGQSKSTNVTISIGSLHLDALRQPKPFTLPDHSNSRENTSLADHPLNAPLPASARLIESGHSDRSTVASLSPSVSENTAKYATTGATIATVGGDAG